jgi:GNAT superfamily N-acetyltransferase
MIRFATDDDMGALLILAEQMHAESDYRRYPFAIDKMARLFQGLMDGAGVVLVAEQADRVVGVMAGYCEESWFTPAKVAGEYGVFVEPGARGAALAAGLVRAFCAWAKEQGADLIQVGVTTGVTTDRTAQLYEKLRFRRTGIVFEYEGD